MTDFDHWEVEITFKVSGRGRVGADGLVGSKNDIILFYFLF